MTTVKDADGCVNLLFVQTSYMKSCFISYGSVLSIDGTYCVNLTGYAISIELYVFLVIDGEGKGHVVGFALVKDEEMATITCLFREFVVLNANSLSIIKTVIVDKDNSELGAIPNANIILCRYHVVVAVSAAIHKKVRKQEVDIVSETVKAPTAECLLLLTSGNLCYDYGDRDKEAIFS